MFQPRNASWNYPLVLILSKWQQISNFLQIFHRVTKYYIFRNSRNLSYCFEGLFLNYDVRKNGEVMSHDILFIYRNMSHSNMGNVGAGGQNYGAPRVPLSSSQQPGLGHRQPSPGNYASHRNWLKPLYLFQII